MAKLLLRRRGGQRRTLEAPVVAQRAEPMQEAAPPCSASGSAGSEGPLVPLAGAPASAGALLEGAKRQRRQDNTVDLESAENPAEAARREGIATVDIETLPPNQRNMFRNLFEKEAEKMDGSINDFLNRL